jgi:hypothetical protein
MVSLEYTPFSDKELVFLDSLRKPSDKSMGLVEGCADSVVVFAQHMLGMNLYYWEIDFLHKLQTMLEGGDIDGMKKTMVLALTSRQIGKSTTLAIFSLWASFFNKKPDKRFNSTQVLIVSRSFDQAKKLLREIKRTYQDGDRFMRITYVDGDGVPIFDGKDRDGKKTGFFQSRLAKDDSNNATSINWRTYDQDKDGEFILAGSNASSGIRCYPPTDVVLGETFTIGMVDEAGHHSIEDDWWFDSLKKTGDANQALWVFTSTPWQPSGFFYEYCDVENKNSTDYIAKLVATIDTLKQDIDAGNEHAKLQYDGVKADIKRDEALGKIDSVRRGYYCEFVRGETTYFNPDSVGLMFKEELPMLETYSEPCDLGIDFGAQKTSKTTLTISRFDEETGKVVRIWHKVYTVGTDTNLVQDVADLMQRFNIQRIIPDECPAGAFMIEEMIQKGWNVTPMSFRTWKVKKYGAFRRMLYVGLIESYVDEDLKKEMFAMEYSQGSTQSYIQHAPGYSDDLIDGFVMSAFHFLDVGDSYEFREW